MIAQPKCYTCKHRRDVPGDSHSSCAHPAASAATVGDGLGKMLSMLGNNRAAIGGPLAADGITVRGNPHGIRRGWFAWPYNFDPVWLVDCTGYEVKP